MASTVYQWLCVEAQQAQVLLREAGAEVRARLLRLHGDGGRAVPLAAASIGIGMASRALSRNTSINLGPHQALPCGSRSRRIAQQSQPLHGLTGKPGSCQNTWQT